ncbi:MAG: hypothetical protein L3K17_08505 [Thermoplasmata archaeon]|nr:hypothetical protein [Thermoplasmata archaeon]
MELVSPDSALPDAQLLTMYEEHREGIRELTASLGSPAYPVTDPARLGMAHSFGRNVLAVLEAPPAPGDREALRRRVNLSYEVMLILIDYAKNSTTAPKVPSGRAKAPEPAGSTHPPTPDAP